MVNKMFIWSLNFSRKNDLSSRNLKCIIIEVSGKIWNSLELSFSCQIEALIGFWNRSEELRNLWNVPEYMLFFYIAYDIIDNS